MAAADVTGTANSKDSVSVSPAQGLPSREAAHDSLSAADGSITADEVMGRLCELLKAQLTKAHQEAVRRYSEVTGSRSSGHVANLTGQQATTAGGEAEESKLDEMVANQLAILKVIATETVPIVVPPSVSSSQSISTTSNAETAVVAAVEEIAVGDNFVSSITAADDLSPMKIVPLSPGSFVTTESVPAGHKFKLTVFEPVNMRSFVQSVRKEIRLLQSSLPPGITVKSFEERMDLYSAMIEGPKNTPYEDGLFFFDFQLGKCLLLLDKFPCK